MASKKTGRLWLPAMLLLLLAMIVGLFIIWLRYEPQQPIKITLPQGTNLTGTIYVSGAVANPGLYPFSKTESVESLLNAAGGPTGSANLSNIRLNVTPNGSPGAQKIDINRADAWLLEALPGVGETLAQRIIDYRQINGTFRLTSDLLKVNGMGNKTYQQIEGLITVGD